MKGLYVSKTYKDDLDFIIEKLILLKHFEGKSIFITGSTGLIGSAVADILLRYSELHNGDIKIYLAGRSRERVTNRFSKYISQKYCIYREYDATRKNELPDSLDYIIHAASNAYPYLIQNNPVETMQDNFCGLMELLQYCVDHTVQNVVYVSSSEIYGRKDNNNPYQ
ncbi:NAD-dependent epimerase/dehydratase family protein, partial [Roseburia faecis]|uniref:NAD-dependent epimerase/dehydratase family protein n=1 Tax=Roseburia faecis TaxID=301302 RepID=UPI0019204DAC